MSIYYKYDFVSPQALIARVKEEFRSFFDTGMIDDTLFPIYIDKCLRRLGKGSYKIIPTVLQIRDFKSRLPDDFFSVREAWLCTDMTSTYKLPGAQYQQVESCSTRLDTPDIYCDKCTECEMPDIIKAVYKTTFQAIAHFKKEYLLKPGNINTLNHCSEDCLNTHSSAPDSFDIQENKFVVTFREGTVYLTYYSKRQDCDGYDMIPDNYRIQEFIEAFLKARVYEQLSNNITDEGQLRYYNDKSNQYQAKADEAYIIADIEAKKETVYDKHRKMKKLLSRFNRYEIH